MNSLPIAQFLQKHLTYEIDLRAEHACAQTYVSIIDRLAGKAFYNGTSDLWQEFPFRHAHLRTADQMLGEAGWKLYIEAKVSRG